MKYINKVTIAGVCQKDFELRKTSTGKDVASGTIKTILTLQDGREIPSFHKVVAWQAEAVYLAQIGKDGAWVEIEGSLSTRSYDDKEGKKVYVTEVTASLISEVSGDIVEDKQLTPDELLNF